MSLAIRSGKELLAPHKFEAGTPNIAGAVGLHAALDYLDALGRKAIHAHDTDLAAVPEKSFRNHFTSPPLSGCG